jgi:hypothetical protein
MGSATCGSGPAVGSGEGWAGASAGGWVGASLSALRLNQSNTMAGYTFAAVKRRSTPLIMRRPCSSL